MVILNLIFKWLLLAPAKGVENASDDAESETEREKGNRET